ncbi:hypothetical protein NKR23_g12349 [Pleurostoma richardsiae]|uniref:DUF7923 domain-containing protein n=1 Tax=Pleurostoma richardsiae TaxID=41990 RepID=A0AA38R0C5_9PEZI|nr:hypothetical protein NKR23_g12349 [Pleurostoma richardsiae]
MEPAAGSYRERFEGLQSQLLFVGELIDELDEVRAKLHQTELDLQNEQDARRRLQQETKHLVEEAKSKARHPFVAVLLDADADGYIFHDKYLVGGWRGGECLADDVLKAIRQYVSGLSTEWRDIDVVVRAFANVNGLGAALARGGRVRDASQLRELVGGFNSRQALFDFVDVGAGKERADHKLRG